MSWYIDAKNITYATGTLQEILSRTGVAAKVRALPNDVAGCTLEMGADGLWTGNLGTLTQAQADALVAAGVMASVKAGTKATVGLTDYSWNGSSLVVTSVITIASKAFWNAQTISTLSSTAQFLPLYKDIIVPANTLGPKGAFSSLKLRSFFNIQNSAPIAEAALRIYLGSSSQCIAATLIAPTSATASRYGRFCCDINYNVHEGQTNFTQARSWSEQLLTNAGADNNAQIVDSHVEVGNAVDWTIAQTLQVRVRLLNTAGGSCTIGSRNYSLLAIPLS